MQLPCPLGCTYTGSVDLRGGAHFATCKRLGQHLRAHGALEDVVLLAMQDAISHRAATGYAGAYLTDERRSEARHNLATTIPITPIHGGEMDRGSFGDLLLVMNTALPASGDHLGRTLGDLTHDQRSKLPRYNNISSYDHWNSQLTKFLRHIDHTNGYYCFVDVKKSGQQRYGC